MKACPRCGYLNPDNAFVCQKCGYYLGNVSATQSTVSATNSSTPTNTIDNTPTLSPTEKPMVKVCPVCGYINPGDASKCLRCGYVFPQPQVVVCPRCGFENPVTATSCLRCGYPLKQETGPIVQNKRKFPTIPVITSVVIAYVMIVILVYVLG
ncbi:zinc-ribbon domain-containing protein [Acidianus sp. HS-5]|uniref:zinc-ribbon domain-containing protein n=1 Tax=Acidianus sp. HS-5 TaxID=2886040 RepID=UPI001F43C2DD|nr:zinc-ribbon domain-containing protein [Acidianus sp. HS-5]BDC17824.1 hypothetical protein HS5_07140 [Acidianus sp. HS-5]